MKLRKSRRPKLAVIGLRGFPNVGGGVEVHCQQLYPELARLQPGFDIHVYMRHRYRTATLFQPGMTVHWLWAPRPRGFESALHSLLAVLHARFVVGVQALHLHTTGVGALAPLARLVGLRVVVTHHSCNELDAKWGGVARAVFAFGRWASRRFADRIVAVSRTLLDDFQGDHDASGAALQARASVEFIPHGIAEPVAREDAQPLLRRLGLAGFGYALMVGRIDPVKDIGTALNAFAQAGPNRPDKLVIVGASFGADDYLAGLKKLAGPDVIFTGPLDRVDVATLMREAAVAVHASQHEGFGLTVLEELMLGTPVIVSDIGAYREFGLDENCYFPVGDVRALATRLTTTSPVPDREVIVANYRLDTMVNRYLVLYQGVLDDRRSLSARALASVPNSSQ